MRVARKYNRYQTELFTGLMSLFHGTLWYRDGQFKAGVVEGDVDRFVFYNQHLSSVIKELVCDLNSESHT